MSGHSKWSTIKRKKGANDAKRGKMFTKLIKEITVAAKEGGADADSNSRLRIAIQNAKGANMPKDTIERAVNKGNSADTVNYSEITYEGYGPNGVAIFVECTTDNTQRSVSNVRSIFSKNDGSLGTNGSLEFIFDRKGVFSIPVGEDIDPDELTLELIDGGAEDVDIDNGYITITTAMEDFGTMQKKLEELNQNIENAELQRIPNTLLKLDDDVFAKLIRLIDTLEDDDDVQKVYHNIDISEKQFASI